MIDGNVIGTSTVEAGMPFTLETATFTVTGAALIPWSSWTKSPRQHGFSFLRDHYSNRA